ncbi:adenylyltransferase/cytidyltransferase family protein [Candidatus Woesebacteria bacterium]|nr:adenylyltransferase/cytidyltransferase family protein [Candidatus Woesebacteria bacterium]
MQDVPASILLHYDQLSGLVAEYRKIGRTIVLTQGSFDMLHIGHARYCATAKQHGDVLFVGVDSDEKIKKRKGPDRPIVPEDERLEMLTHLRYVDHVVLKPLSKPKWELLTLIRPDVLIATADTYTKEQLEELKKYCGSVVVLEAMATTSTSAKIRRVQLGVAKRISANISEKLIKTIEEVLEELKNG